MISIRQPLCFSEIGKKDNQEDYLFPLHADKDSRVFILCDGMGGHDNGEIASKTAASALGVFLNGNPETDIATFEAGMAEAYNALDRIDNNSVKKPGTTMTCLCLNEDSYLAAHIGDSRIYHIRPSLYDTETKRGGILYQSSDHSLVNDLLKAGEITAEEARDFPQKNIITRAMQPHLQKRYKADVYLFDDIEGGDYFFICCDGILEQLDNANLCRIFADPKTDDRQKIEEIRSICDGKTKDNYSCWLIPIDNVVIDKKNSVLNVIKATAEGNLEVICESTEPNFVESDKIDIELPDGKTRQLSSSFPTRFSKSSLKKWLKKLLILLLTLIASGCVIFCLKKIIIKSETKEEAVSEKTFENPDTKATEPVIFILKPIEEDSLNTEKSEKIKRSDSSEQKTPIPYKTPYKRN